MVEKLYNKILIPTDGSKYSEKALLHALSIAQVSNAEIIALSVVENDFTSSISSIDVINEVNNLLREESNKNLQKLLNFRDAHGYDVDINIKIAEGSPVKSIMKTVEDENIDLVVMGSSGKTGFNKMILGSVADKVADNVPCSVLIIR
ncbi:MAG: universal stress protein [archaeon]|nr:universal stress protein [archaeon]